MKTPRPKPQTPCTTQRAVDRLLQAVERSIAAAHDAQKARDELIRLAEKRDQGEASQ